NANCVTSINHFHRVSSRSERFLIRPTLPPLHPSTITPTHRSRLFAVARPFLSDFHPT
ncbi:hypothetical protein J6590_069651, partial [Homalodisca vitripennis]